MNVLLKKDLEIIEVNGLVEYMRQVQHGYKRASTHNQDVVAHRLVEQVTGAKYSMNWGCAKCIFDLYKTLSTYYFKAIEKNNQEKTNKENVKDIKENPAEPITAKPTKQPKPIRNSTKRQKSQKRSV